MPLSLSGHRFRLHYHLRADSLTEAQTITQAIAVEQTIEFPPPFVRKEAILEQVLGQVEELELLDEGRYHVVIAYPEEAAGAELTQFINVLYGNLSLLPEIKLVDMALRPNFAAGFGGPRFGSQGLRQRCGVARRPLTATALKPMGLSAAELAQLAYTFAKGGIDFIKDDHGLSDQVFCPFEERVARCAEAVAKANAETGGKTLYFPNITADGPSTLERARRAKALGAGGVVISPGLAGFGAMHTLASDASFGLPIMSHPAFLGAMGTSAEQGIAHRVLFANLMRLAGADISIFPNFGGRFRFRREECAELVEGCSQSMGAIAPILPAPAGGMKVERIPELLDFYGDEVVLLIGGDLHRGEDLLAQCRKVAGLVARR